MPNWIPQKEIDDAKKVIGFIAARNPSIQEIDAFHKQAVANFDASINLDDQVHLDQIAVATELLREHAQHYYNFVRAPQAMPAAPAPAPALTQQAPVHSRAAMFNAESDFKVRLIAVFGRGATYEFGDFERSNTVGDIKERMQNVHNVTVNRLLVAGRSIKDNNVVLDTLVERNHCGIEFYYSTPAIDKQRDKERAAREQANKPDSKCLVM